MIGIDPDLAAFAARIEAIDIPCLVVGSVATSAYGEPRATIDIDLLIGAFPEDAERIAAAFPAERYYVPPIEVIRRELSRPGRGTFNIIDSDTSLKADLYPLDQDPDNQAGFANPMAIDVPGAGTIHIAPPATIIAGKLRYYKMSQQPKHLRDIRGMILISRDLIDLEAVHRTAERLDMTDIWADCLNHPDTE